MSVLGRGLKTALKYAVLLVGGYLLGSQVVVPMLLGGGFLV